MTACGYCFIFVEYCSKKAMLYKIQRRKWTALVSAKIVQRNLILLSFGMRWRISVCLHFNTQGTVIGMVWISHGLYKIAWWRNSVNQDTDKQTISFLNWKIYSDSPVFTPEKQIRSIFARRPIQANCELLKHNFSTLLNWVRFSKISPKLFEIWQIDQFNIKHGKIHSQTCSIL